MIGRSQKEETETAMGRIAHPIGIVLTVLTCSLVGQAEAQEYCVACSEPSAVYRCVIEGAQPRGGQSLQMLCVTTMAKQGGHATCSVKGGTVFECNGAVKRVPWTPLEAPQQQPEQAQPLPWAQPAPKPEPVAAPPPPVVPASPPARRSDTGARSRVRAERSAGDDARACQTRQRGHGQADEESR